MSWCLSSYILSVRSFLFNLYQEKNDVTIKSFQLDFFSILFLDDLDDVLVMHDVSQANPLRRKLGACALKKIMKILLWHVSTFSAL